MSPFDKPRVIIFSDHLLYPSETFISAQASALRKFEPVFAGSRRVVGLELRDQRICTINPGNNTGKLLELSFKLFGYAPDFARRLRAFHPVLLHAHYGSNGLRVLPLASNLGIPVIVTFHGSDATVSDLRHQHARLGFRHYVLNKPKLIKSDALFLAVSRFIRRKLLEQGFPEAKVLVHYTGVDTKKFQPASTETVPVILFVGRMEESKGAEFLIRAAAEVQKQLPEAEVVLLGDGSLRPGLEQNAKQSLRRYRFLGFRKSEEVREWMNRASLICVPSITRLSGEEEGFGMVCAEAHAVGKPVVAFNSGGISEVVSHAETGFLAAEGDWQAMAEYLFMLLRDAQLRRRFGIAGRERVLRQFDLELQTGALEGIYARVSGANIRSEEGEICCDPAVIS